MACDGALVVALRDIGGKPWSPSFIAASGEKRYLHGAKQPGIYAAFGPKPTTTMYVAEGVATAKSISMAMDAPCAAAIDAGSLPTVAKAPRRKFDFAEKIGAAKLKDDDGSEYRVLVRIKNNIGHDGGGFRYDVEHADIGGGIIGSLPTKPWNRPSSCWSTVSLAAGRCRR